jgi:hypothetical protein
MNQPTFSDGPPVPLMVEGLIDPPTLTRLFADLEAAATGITVREKGGPGEYAGASEISPSEARDRLLNRVTRAVQIRYQFDGHEWTDTVMALPGGFRVVRCRHETLPPK